MECVDCTYNGYGLDGQYCDKVGGKISLCGYCTDVYEDTGGMCINNSKKRRRNKRERDLKYKRHLKNLCGNTSHVHSSIKLKDEICIGNHQYIKNPKPYYKKMSYGSNFKRFYKRYAKKRVRRYKGEISNGCAYKKCFDYVWTID